MLCILKWKAAPRQLPISAEAKPEMQEQGRSQQLGAAVCGAGGGGGHGAPPAQQAAHRAGHPREGPAQTGALRGGWGGRSVWRWGGFGCCELSWGVCR